MWTVVRTAELEIQFADQPDVLVKLNSIKETHPFRPNDSPYKVITGDARKFMGLPSCSLYNGSHDEPWFIDTGIDGLDGALYVGKSDFDAWADMVGYTDSTNLEQAMEKIKELENELDTARRSNRRLLGVVDELRSVAADKVPDKSAPVAGGNAV